MKDEPGPVHFLVSLIVAADEQGAIGKDNRLPWHLGEDMHRFKTLTMGHTLVMGRRTYVSIGRALPGRKTIVITHNPDFLADGCQVVNSVEQALEGARSQGETEAFITGGGEIYAQALPMVEHLYFTRVHTLIPGANIFFPIFDWQEWQILEATDHPSDEKNDYPVTFYHLIKRKATQDECR